MVLKVLEASASFKVILEASFIIHSVIVYKVFNACSSKASQYKQFWKVSRVLIFGTFYVRG